MSVTFQVAKERIGDHNGLPLITYYPVYPAGFDPKQVIDHPEYGPISADNPWSINVTNDNATQLLQLLRQESEDAEMGLVGTIRNLAGFIEACDSALEAIRSFPSLDSGTAATEIGRADGCRIVHCGVPAHYLRSRVSQLRVLAEIAKDVEGVISFA